MRASQLLAALFLMATTALAVECECGGRKYDDDDVEDAVKEGMSLKNAGKTRGKNKWPHPYNDHEDYFEYGNLWEFPIKPGGVYGGGQGSGPGDDRVIFTGGGSAVGCVTHEGASRRGGFKKCDD